MHKNPTGVAGEVKSVLFILCIAFLCWDEFEQAGVVRVLDAYEGLREVGGEGSWALIWKRSDGLRCLRA